MCWVTLPSSSYSTHSCYMTHPYFMLYSLVLYHTQSCPTVLCHFSLHNLPCHAVRNSFLLYNTLAFCTVLHSVILFCTYAYCTEFIDTVLHSFIIFYANSYCNDLCILYYCTWIHFANPQCLCQFSSHSSFFSSPFFFT